MKNGSILQYLKNTRKNMKNGSIFQYLKKVQTIKQNTDK